MKAARWLRRAAALGVDVVASVDLFILTCNAIGFFTPLDDPRSFIAAAFAGKAVQYLYLAASLVPRVPSLGKFALGPFPAGWGLEEAWPRWRRLLAAAVVLLLARGARRAAIQVAAGRTLVSRTARYVLDDGLRSGRADKLFGPPVRLALLPRQVEVDGDRAVVAFGVRGSEKSGYMITELSRRAGDWRVDYAGGELAKLPPLYEYGGRYEVDGSSGVNVAPKPR